MKNIVACPNFGGVKVGGQGAVTTVSNSLILEGWGRTF